MKPKSTLRNFLLSASSLLAAASLHAADGTWTTDANGNWSDSANWNSGAGPIADGADFTALLDDVITGNRTITNDGRTIGNITAADTTHNYTIASGTLTLDVTSGSPTLSVPTGRTLTISSVVAGADGFTKTGDGTVTLSGLNTITGDVIVNGGLVHFQSNNLTLNSLSGAGDFYRLGRNTTLSILDASAFTGNLATFAGGNSTHTIQFQSISDAVGAGNLIARGGTGDSNQITRFSLYGDVGPLTFNNRAIEIRAKGATPSNWSARGTRLQNNNATPANAWVINTDLVNDTDRTHELILQGSNTGDNTFAGVISDATGIGTGSFYSTQTGALTLIKDEAGKWILGGANTYTGNTIIANGTLEIRGAGQLGAGGVYPGNITRTATTLSAFVFDSSEDTTISGTISGAMELIKDGAGTLTITGSAIQSGGTTVDAGTLSLGDGTNSADLSDFGTVSVATGAVVDLNYSGSDTVLRLNLGGSPAAVGTWGATGSGATNINDTFFTGTGVINNLAGDTTDINIAFWDGGTTDILEDGNAVSAGGNGTWDTTIQNWDFGFTAHKAWNNAGNDTAVLGGANGTITLGEAITAGGIASSSTYTISGANTLTLDVASGTPVVNVSANTLTINSQISGTKGLEKTGAGVIRFSTTNTTHDYSGGFTLSQGELNVEGQGSNDSFLGTGVFTIDGALSPIIRMSRSTGVAWTSNNDCIFTGGTILFTRPSGDAPKWQNNGNVTLQGDVTTNRSGAIGYGIIFNGDINDGGNGYSLSFNGLNNNRTEITLAGNNTYSGGTSLSDGANLYLNSSGALGLGSLTVTNLVLDNTSGGPVTIGNSNPINLNGNPTFIGSDDLNLGTGAVTMNNNRTVTVNAGTLTVGGAIGGGNRTLTKAGAGTLVLSGANSYSNTTTVNAGTLALVGGSQESAITVNSGAFLGFTLGSPTTSTKALTLSGGHAIAITGTVNNSSDYPLMTASAITGSPALAAPITDYELELREGDTELWLAYTGTPSSSPFDTWADGTFAGGTLTDKTPTGDDDSDGLSNLLEFAFGTDPTVSDAGSLTWDGTNFTPGSPVVDVDYPIGGGVDFTARFIRRTDHGVSGSAAYAWQFSSDLSDWEASDDAPAPDWFGAPTVLATDGDYQLVEVPYPFFLDNGKKARFFRVVVSLVP